MIWLELFFLALVEGITEFLPISSTGHLIIASSLLDLEQDPFIKSYNIIIQAGAILAVLSLFAHRFKNNPQLYVQLFAGFLPAGIIGLLLHKKIDALLGQVQVVALSLILGGFVLIWLDKRQARLAPEKSRQISDLTLPQCLFIGLFQCLAFVPGVSRAAATICGGLFLGLNRKDAAEFSFILAVPTLLAASGFKLISTASQLNFDLALKLLFGSLIAFLTARVAMRVFIKLLSKANYAIFGYYRILLGIVIFLALAFGANLSLH